jgi:hypothetical protein
VKRGLDPGDCEDPHPRVALVLVVDAGCHRQRVGGGGLVEVDEVRHRVDRLRVDADDEGSDLVEARTAR